jgi:hypothetical protein
VGWGSKKLIGVSTFWVFDGLSEMVRQNPTPFLSVTSVFVYANIDKSFSLCYNNANNQGNVIKHFREIGQR